MTRNSGVWICAVCITGVCLTADRNLWAQDWPQWRGPKRDATAPSVSADSGARRKGFRRERENDSGVKANGIPG
jgi:hypothetical protein